jgi:hypothetical protein
VEDRRRARLGVARRAVSLLRNADFRSSLRCEHGQATATVLAVLSDDPLSYLAERLRDNGQMITTVVVGGTDRHHRLDVLVAGQVDHEPRLRSSRDSCLALPPATEVGMFVDYLRARRGRPVRFSLAPENLTLELLDSDDLFGRPVWADC